MTNVSILVLYKDVSIGWRHKSVSWISIFSISFFLASSAPLFYFCPFSRASVIFCVQSNWIPIKLTWDKLPLTKASNGWLKTWAEAILQCSLIVYCISFSNESNHDSINPSHLTGVVNGTFYEPPDSWMIVKIVFSFDPFLSDLPNSTLVIASNNFSKSSWIEVGYEPWDKIFSKAGLDTK